MGRKKKENPQKKEEKRTVTKCIKCQGIKRSNYITVNQSEELDIVWKTCKCLECGQSRIDRFTMINKGIK